MKWLQNIHLESEFDPHKVFAVRLRLPTHPRLLQFVYQIIQIEECINNAVTEGFTQQLSLEVINRSF